ncbi:MAG: ATP-binding protein [Synergistaceae bacterium]|nr:ATP-binding protein [Synergistaceae bacterium]MBQ3398600.1 ATP-binding protein [Synergistaceae bacterium]MBQ3758974.1 ATP-binding protein [Synergistaceae bacterium]MBQ6003098.1 ATP-binding protein [Synergistaceae bacterium]MBQ6419260.1 ATP-binding protein [Synergistaceae bacterium]
MSDNISIIQRLRENNPFSSPASPLPWNNKNPDLQNLNRDTSEEIEQLIRQKRRQPDVPLAGLILGEAGSGKTHMLTRILRRMRSNAQPAVFAAIRTFRDSESVTQHLLSEIFISLKLIHSNGRSQFDMIVSEVMNSYTERRRTDGFDSTENLDTRAYLRRDLPTLDNNFLKCLLLYMATSNDGDKADILDWLCSGLDDDDSLRLGLPSKDMNAMNDARREQEAEKVLISLGLILGYAKVPMVICFDQLDSMKNREIIEAWGNVIALLMNDLSGILPLCFVRAEIWNSVFIPVLDDAIVQRLKSNTMIMKTCSVKQANQLIRGRVEDAFKEGAEEISSWLISRLSISQEYSPRQVIELSNRVITSPDTPVTESEEIYNTVMNVYGDEYKKVQAEPNSWPPNAEQLALALEVWLSSIESFTVSETKGKYIRLAGLHGDKKFAFIPITAKAHATVSAALKAGMSFMNEYPGSECFYISEDKTHKKTWKQANENLRKFENAGGYALILDKSTRISWYALTALINRIDNGDVNLYLPSGNRTATRGDIKAFVSTLKLIDTKALKFSPASVKYSPDAPKKSPKVYYDSKLFADTLRNIITASPVKILTADKAAALLTQRGIKANRNEVISFVKSNSEDFRTYRSKSNEILITVAEKS